MPNICRRESSRHRSDSGIGLASTAADRGGREVNRALWSALMELDDPRWSGVYQALGAGEELPKVLRKIQDMRSWDSAQWPPREPTPWDYLAQAVYNFGNVHSSAYPVVEQLLSFAEAGRSCSDQGRVFLFALNVVYGPLEGVAAVPLRFIDTFQAALRRMGQMAEACLSQSKLLEGERAISVASAVLGRGHLVAGSIAYKLALEEITLRCECGSDITFEHGDGKWLARSDDDTTAPIQPMVPSRPAPGLECVAKLAALAQLHDQYDHVLELDGTVTCPPCGATADVLELARADVERRCPVARLDGWLSEA